MTFYIRSVWLSSFYEQMEAYRKCISYINPRERTSGSCIEPNALFDDLSFDLYR